MEKQIQLIFEENIPIKAFQEMYPNKLIPKLNLEYSNRFSHYNGNVKFEKFGREITSLTFSLSKKFKDCEEEIQIGVIQELLNKVYKTKIQTSNQSLYSSFVRHLTNYTKKGESHHLLKELFEELKKEYFNDSIDEPTLRFGKRSFRILGNYNYVKDTITISSIFLDEDNLPLERDFIKYVLYHELLHKKHKFRKANFNNMHHTKEFREDEKKYFDNDIESKIKLFLGKRKLRKELDIFSKVKNKLKKFF